MGADCIPPATRVTRARGRLARAGRALVAACLVAIALSGCTNSPFHRADVTDHQTRLLGPRVTVIVTTDGGRQLLARRSVRIERGDTALDVLRQVADVRLAPDGTVAQVNGEGGGALRTFGPDMSAWAYRIDGIESLTTAPQRMYVQPGQSVWWDLRRFDIYERLPVAVGTFPQPLFDGWKDARDPVRIVYGDGHKDDAEYLRTATFADLDPKIVSLDGSGGVAGIGDEPDRSTGDIPTTVAVKKGYANIVIGRWEQVQLDPYIADIGTDPRAFGLTIWLEGTMVRRQDPDMEFSQELPDAQGMVWATTIDGEPDSTLVYVVTGTTDAGVRGAERALTSGACQFYLACAVDANGNVVR